MHLARRLAAMWDIARERLEHNRDPIEFWRARGAKIGKDCRLYTVNFGSEPWLVTLGDHVSATDTSFLTHDGGVWVFRDEWPDADVFGPITVGDNVFFGGGVVVLPGVTIGDNVVIGARSVVSRDIPSNSVAAGVPARVIKSLDEYRASLEPRVVPTARMDVDAKRAWVDQNLSCDGEPSRPPVPPR
jgi:acetyltransferase-like isoleucine patch superfamily enzyme